MSKMKTGYAVRAFNDFGTGQSYAPGSKSEFSEGAYANYKAAGLITDQPPEAQSKAAPKTDDKAA